VDEIKNHCLSFGCSAQKKHLAMKEEHEDSVFKYLPKKNKQQAAKKRADMVYGTDIRKLMAQVIHALSLSKFCSPFSFLAFPFSRICA